MTAQAQSTHPDAPNAAVAPEDVAFLPRGVRLADDRVRGLRVLLGPERAIQLDPAGDAILSELDGIRSVAVIAAALSARFDAPKEQVLADVRDFLSDLVVRRLVFLQLGQQGDGA